MEWAGLVSDPTVGGTCFSSDLFGGYECTHPAPTLFLSEVVLLVTFSSGPVFGMSEHLSGSVLIILPGRQQADLLSFSFFDLSPVGLLVLG